MSAATEETLSGQRACSCRKTFGQQADRRSTGSGDLNRRLAGAPDPPGDGRALVLHDHRHDLLDHAGVRVLAGRLPGRSTATRRPDDRRHRRLHDAPEPALLPARPAAQRPGRDPGRARAVRPDLRVPRPRARDRRRARRGRPRRRRRSRAGSASGDVSFRYPSAAAGARRERPASRRTTWTRPGSPPSRRAPRRTRPAGGRGGRRVGGPARGARGGRRRTGVDLRPASRRGLRPRGHRLRGRAGRARRAGRPVRLGQDHDDLPHPAPVRRRRGRGRDRRPRRPRRSASSRSGG